MRARLELNPEIMKNPYWFLPVEAGHEEYQQAGFGGRTSEDCGRFSHFVVCEDVEHHKGIIIDGQDFTGKLAVSVVPRFCHRATCCVCFARGWATREAHQMEARLDTAVERGLGEVEHIVLSAPMAESDLPLDVLKEKARVAGEVRGITGSGTIFHGRRNKYGMLVWSVHFHALGFVDGGYVCRKCKYWGVTKKKGYFCRCEDFCEGFEQRTRRAFEKDGWIVKVEEKRKSVFGTAYYQLHHSTVKVGLRRNHVVTWNGNCGNRKFKGKKAKAVIKCPVCRKAGVDNEMVKRPLRSSAVRHVERDFGSRRFRPVWAVDVCDEEGVPSIVGEGDDYG